MRAGSAKVATEPGPVWTPCETLAWHELAEPRRENPNLVRASEYEAIYGNMPPSGLGKAGGLVPMAQASTARRRLNVR